MERRGRKPLGQTGLLPVARERLLALLLLRPGVEYHSRDAAIICRLSPNSASQELRRLHRLGIARRRVQGRLTLYQANEECPFYPDLRAWLLKTVGAVMPLQEALGRLPGVDLAFVFGSLADGTTTAESDVDLFILGTAPLARLSRALDRISRGLGREVSPILLTPAEFRQRISRGDHFLTQVIKGPKLWVKGNEEGLGRLKGR